MKVHVRQGEVVELDERRAIWVVARVKCDACGRTAISVHAADRTEGLECPCGAHAMRETERL